MLQPVAQHMMEASSAAENRRSAAFNQLKVVAEALHGLSWLAYTGPNCGERMLALWLANCLACLLADRSRQPSQHDV